MTRRLELLGLLACSLGAGAVSACGAKLPSCDESGIACDWANHSHLPAFNGDGKLIRDSYLYSVLDLTFDPNDVPYVIDWNNHKVRAVVDGKFKTVIGNFVGDGDPQKNDQTAAGAPALECSLNHPTDLVFQPDGMLLIDAWHNHKVRKLDLKTGTEWVVAGRGFGFSGDNDPFPGALFSQEKALALAPDGTLYILDQRNERIRKVDPVTQLITTVVGTGVAGFSGDGGDPSQAQLSFEFGDAPQPSGDIKLDPQGRLYIADSLNNRIRRADFSAHTIETIAGTGQAGYSGDDGPALQATFNNPRDMEWGPDGRLYIADTENHRIRAIDVVTGIVTTFAGSGKVGCGAEQQPATHMDFNRPFGIAFDKPGNLYVADTMNNRIVKVAR